MMLYRNKNITFNSHLKIFKTYKELNKILPFSYIQTRVSPNQKYTFKNQPLKKLEKEKRPIKITKNILYNKNIYIFSEENENIKKIINKKLFVFFFLS